MAEFVNPYTFVPHVPSPDRRAPAGHAQMRDGSLSGVLKVTLTARTPLVIGGFNDKNGGQMVPRREPPDGRVMIPGSGFLGAVRSVHETLVGGCLRVLDTEWVPVHRHPAKGADTADLRLAVVTDVIEAEDPKKSQVTVAVCEEQIMVPYQLLPVTDGEVPKTGDQLQYPPNDAVAGPFPAGAVDDKAGRKLRVKDDQHKNGLVPGVIRRAGPMGALTSDRWVLLVSDTKARPKEPVRFALGRVGPGSRQYTVQGPVMEQYLRTVDKADDLRPGTLVKKGFADGKEPPRDPEKPEHEEVTWPNGNRGVTIAKRLRARTFFHVGQPVWVKVSDPARGASPEVTEVRLSVLWRYEGGGPLGERVGHAGPCREPESLCWSCRMFGSADTGGREEQDLAVQKGYRGHVRFDDLLTEATFAKMTWDRAPLSSPSPGAGQFYLDNSKVPPDRQLAAKDTKPAATWGSEADKPTVRPIRGRKFYWQDKEDPREGRDPRGRRRSHQSDKLSKKVDLIPGGTVFTGRVRFDNLSIAEYGSLLAALDPRLLAGADDAAWQKAATSVGGGKPFGFGSVRVDVEPELVQTAHARYLGEPGPDAVPDKATAVQAFVGKVPDTVRRQHWEPFRHVLTPGYVNDSLIWYPPGPGNKGAESFDHSYEFFARSNGVELPKSGNRKMVFLPDPKLAGEAQVLESPPVLQPSQDNGTDRGKGRGRQDRNRRGGRG